MSRGYSYRASYTIGDAIDQAPEHLNASSGRPQNGRDLEAWEGPSDFDIRHRFVANFIAELPFGEGKPYLQDGVAGKILGGWMVTGIYSARSGRPITITQGNNNVGAGMTGLPNLTGDPKGAETVEQWFNPLAFTRVTSGTFGNAGRNILRGPGWVTFDMSVQRRVVFTDRVNATLRWDIFNLFGLIPLDPTVLPLIGPFLHVGAWPLIMGVTMWFQMKLNPAPPDPTQAMIFNWMPLIFTFMLASFPAGLVIYWAWNNLLSVLQQSVIMRKHGAKIELFDNIKAMFVKDKPQQ